jgi:hypothetical protein
MGLWSPTVRKLVVGAVVSAGVGEVARPILEELGSRVKRFVKRATSGTADVGALEPDVRAIERTTRAVARGALSAVVPGVASEPRRRGGGKRGGTYKCTCTGGAGEACSCGSQTAGTEAGAFVPGPIPWIPGGDDDAKRRRSDRRARRRAETRAEKRAETRLKELETRLTASIKAATGPLRDELTKRLGATRRLRTSLPRMAPKEVQKVAEEPPAWLERVLEKLTDRPAAAAAAPAPQPYPVPMSPFGYPMYPWAPPQAAAPPQAPQPAPAPAAAPAAPQAPQPAATTEDVSFDQLFQPESSTSFDQIFEAADALAEQSLAGAFLDPDVVGAIGEDGAYEDDDESGAFDEDEAGAFDDDEDDDEAGAFDDVSDAIAGAEICGSCR